MTRKIFSSILLVAAAVLIAGTVIIMGFLYDYFGGIQEQELRDQLDMASAAVEEDGENFLSRISSERYRLTWIAADGTVVYDTQTDAESLENHAQRDEIKNALETGQGESTRYSATLLEKTMYYAKRLGDGSILRISVSRGTVGVLVLGTLQPMLIVLLLALILSAILAGRLSKRIVEPLNELDLEHPLENDSYEELSPLLNRINRQHRQIAEHTRELQKRTEEFGQITASMQEGLVLLDNNECILSINPAAQKFFSAGADCVGKSFLLVDRSYDIQNAVQAAMERGHSEVRIERGGMVYQVDVSRIQSAGETAGAVLLSFDITERENAERNRREFTANVSHELKTPLQGIIGSAELIENGMVKPEDMPRFVGHIRDEAQRLVTLIGDIIRLSQLDEGEEMPVEPVNLLDISMEAAADLSDAAGKRGISISVDGAGAVINGVRRLAYEIVYNLCDNAIKYNVDGGRVEVKVFRSEGRAGVTVADTGIGIAPEDQSRIFERFYRVDKSHSKASGGTGLGLSIVKHAVQYMGGRTEISSQPGKGTSITVSFPV